MGSCVEPVTQYLQSAVDEWIKDRTLDVPITLEGQTFDVRFIPEVTSAEAMASKLCADHAAKLGINEETFPNCANPVGDYLRRAVGRWIAEKTLSIPVTVSDITFDVQFMPERQTAVSMASKLCYEHARTLQLSTQADLDGCVSPVGEYLQAAANDWTRSKLLEVVVNVNEMPYTLRFMPERVPAVDMARKLCVDQAEALVLTEETIVPNCVSPVTDYLVASIDNWLKEKTISIPIKFGEQTSQLEFMPERENSLYVARKFCAGASEALGLTNETVVTECINPVTKLVREEVQKWAAKRSPPADAASVSA